MFIKKIELNAGRKVYIYRAVVVETMQTLQASGIQQFQEGVISAEVWGCVGEANYKETIVW